MYYNIVVLVPTYQQYYYSEVPKRRACSLRFFRFSFHPARNFLFNTQIVPTFSFVDLLSKKSQQSGIFFQPACLFRSASLLGTSEYVYECCQHCCFLDLETFHFASKHGVLKLFGDHIVIEYLKTHIFVADLHPIYVQYQKQYVHSCT